MKEDEFNYHICITKQDLTEEKDEELKEKIDEIDGHLVDVLEDRRRHYQKAYYENNKEKIKEVWSKNKTAILQKERARNSEKGEKQNRRWTPKDEERLLKASEVLSYGELSRAFERSIDSVKDRLRRIRARS